MQLRQSPTPAACLAGRMDSPRGSGRINSGMCDAVWKSLGSNLTAEQRGCRGPEGTECPAPPGLVPLPCHLWRTSERLDSCRAVGSRAGTGKVLIRMLAALVGVGVWLEGGVEEAAWALLCHAQCKAPGSRKLVSLRGGQGQIKAGGAIQG